MFNDKCLTQQFKKSTDYKNNKKNSYKFIKIIKLSSCNKSKVKKKVAFLFIV